jgi:anaerobic glycerol-3-phosphate dehydrogenase
MRKARSGSFVSKFVFYRLRIIYEPVIILRVGVKNQNLRYFDAKRRFALRAWLRSAIFIEMKADNF